MVGSAAVAETDWVAAAAGVAAAGSEAADWAVAAVAGVDWAVAAVGSAVAGWEAAAD